MSYSRSFIRWLGIGVGAAAVFALNAHAAGVPGPLVDAQWVHDHLDSVTVVDVREAPAEFTAKPAYGAADKDGKAPLKAVGGHIPGAHLIDFGAIRTTQKIDGRDIKAMLPTAEQFQTVMRDAGVDNGKPLVIACAGDGVNPLDMAARLYWTLKTFGVKDVAILNGGTAAWLESGYAISTDPAATAKGNWTAKKADLKWFADSANVAKAKADKVQLIDARPTSQFLGITKKPVVKEAGHIAGAHSFPVDAIVKANGAASYFMTEAEYSKILPQLGINAKTPTITYCNTGHLASGAWFVMHEVMGNRETRLYDGSMLEWTAEGHPTVGG